jgi:hypothetical protein
MCDDAILNDSEEFLEFLYVQRGPAQFSPQFWPCKDRLQPSLASAVKSTGTASLYDR